MRAANEGAYLFPNFFCSDSNRAANAAGNSGEVIWVKSDLSFWHGKREVTIFFC